MPRVIGVARLEALLKVAEKHNLDRVLLCGKDLQPLGPNEAVVRDTRDVLHELQEKQKPAFYRWGVDVICAKPYLVRRA